MKKRVTYEIKGQIERSCYFRVGKALLRVDFTGGAINSAGMMPAFYTTDNPLYQKAIEDSEQFRRGEITIGNSEQISEEKDNAELSIKGATADSGNTYTEVTNVQQARTVLMSEPYSIPLSELQNKNAIRAKAAECGILFPNWL